MLPWSNCFRIASSQDDLALGGCGPDGFLLPRELEPPGHGRAADLITCASVLLAARVGWSWFFEVAYPPWRRTLVRIDGTIAAGNHGHDVVRRHTATMCGGDVSLCLPGRADSVLRWAYICSGLPNTYYLTDDRYHDTRIAWSGVATSQESHVELTLIPFLALIRMETGSGGPTGVVLAEPPTASMSEGRLGASGRQTASPPPSRLCSWLSTWRLASFGSLCRCADELRV
jgi:hypothetical protein